MTPRIGMPLCLDERGRWRAGRDYHYVAAAYAEAIESAGGIPVYLPLQARATAALDAVDALLIPGGDDLLPTTPYPAHVRFEPVPERQLGFDRALLEAALARGMPVLGICYGAQLLALACGGSLHYDLATDLPGADDHQLGDHGRHPLRWATESALARALGAPTDTNSRHHQAIADPGRLVVCAWSQDGVVEAIEAPTGPFCAGVQWHPENLPSAGRDPVFAALVRAATRD